MSLMVNEMHFKLVQLINEFNISFTPLKDLKFKFGDLRQISVRLRPPTEREREKYKGYKLLFCEARSKQNLSNEVHNIFSRLSLNQMPEDFRKPISLSRYDEMAYSCIDDEGIIEKGVVPSVRFFSTEFQDFEAKILNELTVCIKKTVKTIRWKLNRGTSHDPVKGSLGVFWSFNGRTWKEMPRALDFSTSIDIIPNIYGAELKKINSLIKNQDTEPLGHELFLEAWGQRFDNPRSSLVVGIVSAEVGLKQCIANLVPDARWLVDELPSPPLRKMVAEYVPMLPARLKIENKVLGLPKKVKKALTDGVELRNKTIHVGSDAPSRIELEELLLSVLDLLYLLDYYCGYEWAINNIRSETLEAMKQEYNLR